LRKYSYRYSVYIIHVKSYFVKTENVRPLDILEINYIL